MMISHNQRKALKIHFSGRSSDYISPSFVYGCLLNCSYCYMKRHKPKGMSIATNMNHILDAINRHVYFEAAVKKPNQTHEKYISYDIGCNQDWGLDYKYFDWKYIFDFFKNHEKAFATFATKMIPEKMLQYNPEQKVRIRFSLTPQKVADIIEPYTAKAIDKIKAIDKFIDAGYDVHINYSPVIVHKQWLNLYNELFELVDKNIKQKDTVKSEVIFLTHNENKHLYNIENNIKGENLIWVPSLQENKVSQMGGHNVRYKRELKSQFIEQFKSLHKSKISFNEIRYIF